MVTLDIVRVLGLAAESARRAKDIEPSDGVRIAAIRWEIYSSLQNLLDSLAMIVADLGLIKPHAYVELGAILCEKGVLGEGDAELIEKVAATINVIAHAYRKVEAEDLVEVASDLLPKVEDLCKFLMGYVRDSNLDPEMACPSTCTEVFKKHGVKLVYLFGSRAKTTAREDSDYDFAVLFGGKTTVKDEVELMLNLADALNVSVDRVDVVVLDKADQELVYRVLKEGKLVYASSEGERRLWERSALMKALESRDIYDVYMKRIRNPKYRSTVVADTLQQSSCRTL